MLYFLEIKHSLSFTTAVFEVADEVFYGTFSNLIECEGFVLVFLFLEIAVKTHMNLLKREGGGNPPPSGVVKAG